MLYKLSYLHYITSVFIQKDNIFSIFLFNEPQENVNMKIQFDMIY